MPMVKVWNDNIYPYKEEFQGEKINIGAHSFIWMDEGKAHEFKCSFAPIVRNADGVPTAEGYKKIRIEVPTSAEPAPAKVELTCPVCRYKASSAKDLEEHCKAKHSDALVIDKDAERETQKNKRA